MYIILQWIYIYIYNMGISSLKYNFFGDKKYPQKILLAGDFFLGQKKGHLILRHTVYIYRLNTISFEILLYIYIYNYKLFSLKCAK